MVVHLSRVEYLSQLKVKCVALTSSLSHRASKDEVDRLEKLRTSTEH